MATAAPWLDLDLIAQASEAIETARNLLEVLALGVAHEDDLHRKASVDDRALLDAVCHRWRLDLAAATGSALTIEQELRADGR